MRVIVVELKFESVCIVIEFKLFFCDIVFNIVLFLIEIEVF